jgi:oligopeptide transport system substrate-binding protein
MKKAGFLAVIVSLLAPGAVALAAGPQLHKTQEMTYNLVTEPKSIDPTLSQAVVEATIIINNFEGLTRLGPGDVPQPGVAEKWEISKDGLTYTFHLRKDAKWSNGDPVTAQDFEFAWKRALDPKAAAEYAYQLYYLKNGEAFNTKKITDPEQIGVKAKDDRTLVVTLEGPCPYFLSLGYFPTLSPLHRKTVESNPEKWTLDPKTYIGNGPFKMTKWVHNERMEFEPNSNYWDKKVVKLKKLTFLMVEEQSTSLTMFESGQIDLLDDNGISRPEIPRLQASGALKFNPYLGTYYYMFNTKKSPTDNLKVRHALALAIDRGQIVKFITKAGETPASAFVPNGVPDAVPGQFFRPVGGSFFKDNDLAAAKKLLTEAGYPDGKGFPAIEILYNTHEMHKQIAEAIQEMWKKNLGINVTLTNQEWKVYMTTRRALSYNGVARAGWIGDYVDPMTFIDLWTSTSGNNQTGWGSPKYDELVKTAKMSGDPKVRMKAMHDAEAILMQDMPVAPIYFYTKPFLAKDWVKDVNQSALGFMLFNTAYVAAH